MLVSMRKILVALVLLQGLMIIFFLEWYFWKFQNESRVAYALVVQAEIPYSSPIDANESLLDAGGNTTNTNISLPPCPLRPIDTRFGQFVEEYECDVDDVAECQKCKWDGQAGGSFGPPRSGEGPYFRTFHFGRTPFLVAISRNSRKEAMMLEYPSYENMSLQYPSILTGGRWRPHDCVAHQRVAIIVPYRNRELHLRAFLNHIHRLLRRQQRNYGIYIVEQVQNQTFNRAQLMNIGFVEASKRVAWDCFIFHDVDMLPEMDQHSYTCDPNGPKQLVEATDKSRYPRLYDGYFGGVSALTASQMRQLNGYSNDYWGWGGEDDDMALRIELNNFTIVRYTPRIGRYKMIRHIRDKGNAANPCRWRLLENVAQRWSRDGLNNLKYNLMEVEIASLYTRFAVELLEKESKDRLTKEKVCDNK